jgi:2-succinyl-6-hydroxy-2,4-cyclohexadiene-1-carboxylate synthase
VSPAPLLLLHGFTGSAASWDELCRALGSRLQTLAADLVGHAPPPAPADPARYSMEACVEELRALLEGPTCVLGYSMGARVALHLALAVPEGIAGLVLESASPGIEDPNERAARVAADEELATFIEQRGLEAFVERWERTPLLALGPHVPEAARTRQREQRLARDPRGLASSLRGMGAGRQAPVWHRLPELRLPVLLIVGERDTKYQAIAQRMLELLPRARLEVVPDAGHTVHLEQPARFAAVVTEFVESLTR